MSKLQNILLRLKAACRWLFQLPKRIVEESMRFFKNNPHLIAASVTAFATFVIAIYAIFTYGVQRGLKAASSKHGGYPK